jgi:4-hydroxy-3-polyprenylbenzoate decarboxylase
MMDLREFLKVLEEEHELTKVKLEVDPRHELGAICKIHNERANSPALLFENVKGHEIPVVGQLLASDRRVALALGLSQEDVFNETVSRKQCRGPANPLRRGWFQKDPVRK